MQIRLVPVTASKLQPVVFTAADTPKLLSRLHLVEACSVVSQSLGDSQAQVIQQRRTQAVLRSFQQFVEQPGNTAQLPLESNLATGQDDQLHLVHSLQQQCQQQLDR